tara:strand:- start:391 stop:687 length:297 start_codon:yes stop_codon:yes gene_type:complete
MDKKLSRSHKLRKIETIYNKYITLFNTNEDTTENPKKALVKRKKSTTPVDKDNKNNKPLNDYQKFVKKESKKDIYKDMLAKDRLFSISKLWNDKKSKF